MRCSAVGLYMLCVTESLLFLVVMLLQDCVEILLWYLGLFAGKMICCDPTQDSDDEIAPEETHRYRVAALLRAVCMSVPESGQREGA